MMSYSAINAKVAVPGSKKKKTAVTKEEEPLPFTEGDTEDETLLYGEEDEY